MRNDNLFVAKIELSVLEVNTDSSQSSPSQALKKGPVKSLLKRTQVTEIPISFAAN
jgi:hypothetical protein